MIVVALILVIGIVFGAFYYVKTASAGPQPRPAEGFSNPAYASAPAAQQQTTGYMDISSGQTASQGYEGYADVPAMPSQTTGYMDVSPADDDEAEDV